MRKVIKWENITVKQFQQVYKRFEEIAADNSLDDMEKAGKAIEALFEMTAKEVDELTISEFNHKSKICTDILDGKIPGKAVRITKPLKQRYKIIYKVNEIKHGKYTEISHFAKKPIENIHFIMASVVTPINWFGRKSRKEITHKEIADEMLNARIIDVYHACVFFCKLFNGLMESIKPYLLGEMMETGLTKEAAEVLLDISSSILGGSSVPEKSQHSKA